MRAAKDMWIIVLESLRDQLACQRLYGGFENVENGAHQGSKVQDVLSFKLRSKVQGTEGQPTRPSEHGSEG